MVARVETLPISQGMNRHQAAYESCHSFMKKLTVIGAIALLCINFAYFNGYQNIKCTAWKDSVELAENNVGDCYRRVEGHERAYRERATLNCMRVVQDVGGEALSEDIRNFCYSKGKIPPEWRIDTNRCQEVMGAPDLQNRSIVPLSCYRLNELVERMICARQELLVEQGRSQKPFYCF